ncbi:MAG: hypothetical protein AB7O98_07090 [Hyphomonadaceae bacterium]
MTRTPLPPRGGIAALWVLFCAVALVAGVAFDFMLDSGGDFWIGAQPGGGAALGAGAAVFVIAAARIARWVLTQSPKPRDAEGGADAVDHA